MFKSLDIQKDMEVVGLDGEHVGTVDHLETADRIILSKGDPKAGGRRHLIWIDSGRLRGPEGPSQQAVDKSNIRMADGCLSLVFSPRTRARPLGRAVRF